MTGRRSEVRASADTNIRAVVAVLLPLALGYVALFVWALDNTSYDVWGALLVTPALVAVSLPILLRYGRGESDPRVGQILVLALLLKLAAAVPRYLMVTGLYGTGDSIRYSRVGTELRLHFLDLNFNVIQLGGDGSGTGTRFIEVVTGFVYTLIGPSFIGGFVFFSWLSFWGLFFFFRAFRVGIPDGDAKRYAVLLFFLPSMLFWPSSIGKEAWLTLVLGLTAYGCARLYARRPGATLYLAAGLAGIVAVRPHLALIVIAGLGFGYVLRSSGTDRAVALGRMRTVIGLGIIGVGTMLVIRRVAAFFEIDDFNVDTAVETLESTEEQTSTGGSGFAGGGPSFRNLPMNIVTVLFRPFAFEVSNIQALLAALEGTILMILFVLALPRFKSIPRRLRKQPYIACCLTYAILFCFMFAAFQNFGILARQRVLVFPLVLVLLALPLVTEKANGPGRRRGSRRRPITRYAESATSQ